MEFAKDIIVIKARECKLLSEGDTRDVTYAAGYPVA